jgi:UDPglucose--hexose-1-phosphate uridylyltransferase
MNISYEIERLIQYGIYKKLISQYDVVYTRNRIMEVLGIDEVDEVEVGREELDSPSPILESILEWAVENGKLEGDGTTYRDLFDTKVMGCLVPKPSEVINRFYELYKKDSAAATDYFYGLSRASDYIRTERVKKDLRWKTITPYGDIDITINLSKPVKDPKAIAAARNIPSSRYPKCLLCRENEGYAGRLNHPARQNHRIIPLNLNGEEWFFQYSPYVYYNEHCIVLKGKHEPMKISKDTFIRLLDFVEQFPHYFIGSNADFPIVGGSILSHDHFQGGNYEFAMASAEVEKEYDMEKLQGVSLGRIKWPMSVLRLEGSNKSAAIEAADYIKERWRNYTDEAVGVFSNSSGVPHNTVTPIARMKNGKYQLDLVLRNNRTSEEHPDGIFHPHRELHHIKKENIGLIEVMGLAVLPARLNTELKELSRYLTNRSRVEEINENEELAKHVEWYRELIHKYPDINEENIEDIIRREVGLKFLKVLEHAGVFKRDEEGMKAFDRFVESL